MKTGSSLLLVLLILVQFVLVFPAESRPEITCGQTITEDTILTEDLACPPDAEYAIVIGASNITLDLGGYTISGYTPRTGVFAIGQEGITIRNGSIDGFNVGVYIDQTNRVTMENLTVRNLESSDPSQFLFGIAILGSVGTAVYRSELAKHLPAGVPPEAEHIARDTLGAAVGVAGQLPGPSGLALLATARDAFVQGLHLAAGIGAVVAIGAAIMAMILLRCEPANPEREAPPDFSATGATATGE